MRYMLTLSAVHDDDLDAADLEVAATDVWGELYVTDTSDPVEFATAGAIVLDADGLADLIGTLNTARRTGIPASDDLVDSIRQTLSDARARCEVKA